MDGDGATWTVAGAAVGFTLLSAASIGLFVLPFALALIVMAARLTAGRGTYGVAVGAGLIWAAICLPQDAFAGLGWFGVAVMAGGVVTCLARHRTGYR